MVIKSVKLLNIKKQVNSSSICRSLSTVVYFVKFKINVIFPLQSSFAAEAEELNPCCATEILYKPQMLAVLVYLIAQSCSNLCDPKDYSTPGSKFNLQ